MSRYLLLAGLLVTACDPPVPPEPDGSRFDVRPDTHSDATLVFDSPSDTTRLPDADTLDANADTASHDDTGEDTSASHDARIDSGIDTPFVDSGRDAPIDSGRDALIDSGRDAPIDSGRDAPIDSGRDAPIDSGRDAPIDSGSDAGVTNPFARRGFTQILLLDRTRTATQVVTWIRDREGMRHFAFKVPWAMVADGSFANLARAAADYIQTSGRDLRFKVMVIVGESVPPLLYTHPTQPIRRFRRFNVTGSGNRVSGDIPVPWDPNLAAHYAAMLSTLRAQLQVPSSPGAPTPLDYVYAIQSSLPTVDENTEVPDSYGGPAPVQRRSTGESVLDLPFQLGALESGIGASTTTLVATFPGTLCSTAAAALPMRGLLLLERGACWTTDADTLPNRRESVAYSSWSCSQVGTTARVSFASTGRGWNGGYGPAIAGTPGGQGSGPARSFSVGDCVHVRDVANSQYFIDLDGSTALPAFEFMGSASAQLGFVEIPTANRNQWARVGELALPTATVDGYSRIASGSAWSVLRSGTTDTRSDLGRAIAIGRAWLNSVRIALDTFPPTVSVWQHSGHHWTFAGSTSGTVAETGSVNDALRDFLRGPEVSVSDRQRLILGYTVAYTYLSDSTLSEEFANGGLNSWRAETLRIASALGIRLGIQTEAPRTVASNLGREEQAIDYLYSVERVLSVWGARANFVESNGDRSPRPGTTGAFAIYDPALSRTGTSGPPSLPPQLGSMMVTNRTYHEMLYGRTLGGGPPADAHWLTDCVDCRIRRLGM